MKKSKMSLVGAIIVGVGIVGLFGIIQAENKGAILFGSLILIVIGAMLLFFGIKKNSVKTTERQTEPPTPVEPPKVVAHPVETFQEVNVEKKSKAIPSLNVNEVIERYLTSAHSFCPEKYDYNAYKREEFICIAKSLKRAPVDVNEMISRKQKVSGDLSYYTRPIEKNASLASLGNFIAIDTETTGLNPENNKIIEIAAVKFVAFKPVEIFSTYLDPKRKIPKVVEEKTGISDFMVENCPTFPQIQDSFEEFINGYNLIMHNAKFDLSFLYYRGCCIDCQNQPVYDTLTLAKKYLRDSNGEKYPSYSLEAICWRYHIHPVGTHGAETDALATGLLFNEIVKSRLNVSYLR